MKEQVKGRAVGSHGSRTMAAIRRVGLRLIYTHGYEAISLRRLASEVGIQTSWLPNQIIAKQALLSELIKTHIDELLHRTDRALKGIEPPDHPLRAGIGFHPGDHPVHKWEVFISYYDLRSLDPENHGAGVALRRAYERKLMDIPGCGVVRAAPTVSGAPLITKQRRIARPSRSRSAITMERAMFHRRIYVCGLLGGSFLCQRFLGHLHSMK